MTRLLKKVYVIALLALIAILGSLVDLLNRLYFLLRKHEKARGFKKTKRKGKTL